MSLCAVFSPRWRVGEGRGVLIDRVRRVCVLERSALVSAFDARDFCAISVCCSLLIGVSVDFSFEWFFALLHFVNFLFRFLCVPALPPSPSPAGCIQIISGTESGSLLLWDGNFIQFVIEKPKGETCHKACCDAVEKPKQKTVHCDL